MIRPVRQRLSGSEEGFTLIETLVTILLMLTVMFALYNIFDMSVRVFAFGNNKVEAVENARVGMEKMTREIKAAYPVDKPANPPRGYLFFNLTGATSDPPQATLGSAQLNSTQITFGNDLNGDRQVTCPPSPAKCEYVTYKLTGQPSGGSVPACTTSPCTLRRVNSADPAAAGDPLAENVKPGGLTFTYLNSGGTAAAGESDVKTVRIKLEVSKSGGTFGNGTQTLTTDVSLNNRQA